MGDHRASIKIQFEMHGVKKEVDMWINYSPYSEEYGVDQRILDWIKEAYEESMNKWEAGIAIEETRAAVKAKKEREELFRELKAEFEPTIKQEPESE